MYYYENSDRFFQEFGSSEKWRFKEGHRVIVTKDFRSLYVNPKLTLSLQKINSCTSLPLTTGVTLFGNKALYIVI
jgi:hypothetical protein